jgi:DNA-binding PadR family transcriptional regulator
VERPLSILEVFLLALIERGIASPYRLQDEGNISIGASIPALRRLAELGLVKKGEMGARRRRDYDLTGAGRKALRAGLAGLPAVAKKPPADLETGLRAAALAAAAGKVEVFRNILDSASAALRTRASHLQLDNAPDASNPAALYRALFAFCSTKTLRSQAEALQEVQHQIHVKR